jgi:DNA polymerase
LITVNVRTFEDWRNNARTLVASETVPDEIYWNDGAMPQDGLFAAGASPMPDAKAHKVPRALLTLASEVACNQDPGRWSLLYRLLWRVTHENHDLLKITVDDDVRRAERLADEVRREIHRMHAFVRFRKVATDSGDHYVAWFRPDHHVLREAVPFFVDRFRSMHWSILTPEESAHWNGTELTFTSGVPRSRAPQEDELESLWRTYYGATFNPARVNLKMMRQHAPQRYWPQMPEMETLAQEVAAAPGRVERMIKLQPKGASAYLPESHDLATMAEAVKLCRGCDLYCHATQAVFGEGPANARVVLIGEQPGDQEDLAGKPFVGPAGEVLNRAIAEAGLERGQIYVTNAVKHFAFEQRGKRRIHRTPRLSEVTACRAWVEAELDAVRPEVVVCLGATAAKALLGTQFRITAQRGQFLSTRWSQRTIATFHPSAVLRAESAEHKDEIYAALVNDLKRVAEALQTAGVDDESAPGLFAAREAS